MDNFKWYVAYCLYNLALLFGTVYCTNVLGASRWIWVVTFILMFMHNQSEERKE